MFDIHRDQHTVTLTLDAPARNELSIECLRSLSAALGSLRAERAIMALIVTGTGEFFSAGAKLGSKEQLKDRSYVIENAAAFAEAMRALRDFPVLTIASINGYAFGGGLELALACDTRIADEQALFALPEPRLGMTPCGGGTLNLPSLIGPSWSKRMILCGEYLSAGKAREIGLVDEVCGKGQCLVRGRWLARQAALQSPDSARACKGLLSHHENSADGQGWQRVGGHFVEVMSGSNASEGIDAFFEKREPNWSYAQ